LEKLKKEFVEGKITKANYIHQMYSQHKKLFEYSKFIKNTDIKKIEIEDGRVIITSRDLEIKLICEENDERIPPIETLNFDYYEKDESQMMYNLIEDGFTIFDIGANIGWYSIGITKAKNNIKIFAFEPILKTYKNLLANIELNKSQNIQTFNMGLHKEKTQLIFYFYPEISGNASSVNLSTESNPEIIKCDVDTMDNFIKEQNVTKLDFIKIDIEGAELFAFEGGINTIKKFKPIVFTEMLRKWSAKFGYHPNKIIEIFNKINYNCFVVKENRLEIIKEMNEETVETNFFFLHKEKHSEQISKYNIS
jgi:FkbM family methyltransferase